MRRRVMIMNSIALVLTFTFLSAPVMTTAGSLDQQINLLESDVAVGVIVRYRAEPRGSALAARVGALQEIGARRGLHVSFLRTGALGTQVFKLDRATALAEIQQLSRDIVASDPNVEYAEPDQVMRALLVPNDARYNEQWHYFDAAAGINLPSAWDLTTGAGINVAVLDTGYRPHVDLAANIVGGYDFITSVTMANDGNGRDSDARDPGDSSSSQPSSWHGTHVSGTIAAVTNNGMGVAGVAFGARVVPVRVLGVGGGTVSDIADAIVWASGGTVSGVPANSNPARVLNLSLGGGGACAATFQNAINSARSRNSVVVSAAGNSGWTTQQPGNCAGVITVAAVNRIGGRASYSSFGADVEIAAPGGDTSLNPGNGVLSTLNTGTSSPGADSYVFYQGTSMATPHVSGVVALMLARNSALTPDQIVTRLQQTAKPFPAPCSGCGSGIVDATAAVAGALPPSPRSDIGWLVPILALILD